ncbi:CGNR zinc finger domain-containing protein [Actinomycetospora sp.]|uniref:CGNR zinc finger domain-containing protein n=1 Tax=Actinomycetospora sp. TaxID=1872135 RepID=UPI002F3EE466
MTTSAPRLGEPWPVELMNTVWADRDGVHDTLEDPEAARAWLESAAAGIGGPTPGSKDGRSGRDPLPALRTLRNALRRLAAQACGDTRTAWTSPTPDADRAIADLNGAVAAAPSWSTLRREEGGGLVRETRTGGPPALAVVSLLAEEGVDLFAGPRAEDLRACEAPGCVLYFVKAHPRREWCSSGCGNRARVARHYRRHHPGEA